jgi:peroxiredoxin/predicted amidophosphoribosyltransferase
MTDERTQGTDFGQRQRVQKAPDIQTSQQLQQVQQQGAVVCPNCGAMNAEDAQNCASCGAHLKGAVCPHCGCAIDADADFCEVCHHYIRKDVCSFCGSPLRQEDSFCPECGSPRGGIVCPTCHTLNDFAFCKQCGTPLTDEARLLLAQVKQMPEYQEMAKLAREYDELTMEQPYETERDASRDLAMQQFRERVLRLLAQDNGIASPIIPKVEKMRLSKGVGALTQGKVSKGDIAPDIALRSIKGDTVRLSSLKGKYILLDFWASWSDVSKINTENLNKIYWKYRYNNFVVYQVALEEKSDDWKNGLKAQKIPWVSVSDLKLWNSSAAETYGVRALPASFLIGPDLKVLGVNLSAEELDDKLLQLVGKPIKRSLDSIKVTK